jgi:hypothetical protein
VVKPEGGELPLAETEEPAAEQDQTEA